MVVAVEVSYLGPALESGVDEPKDNLLDSFLVMTRFFAALRMTI
jgi:hypothetical protein